MPSGECKAFLGETSRNICGSVTNDGKGGGKEGVPTTVHTHTCTHVHIHTQMGGNTSFKVYCPVAMVPTQGSGYVVGMAMAL